MLLWGTDKNYYMCYEQIFHSCVFTDKSGKRSCTPDLYRIKRLWKAARGRSLSARFSSRLWWLRCAEPAPSSLVHCWGAEIVDHLILLHRLKKVHFFCCLILVGEGRGGRQGEKAGVWAQNCIWGGALLMLVLFSALSSQGVYAGLNRQSSSQVPYASWRCLSCGLVQA